MLTNRTVSDLLDAFSAPDPTPGGGSASALAGALGVSLLAMVAGLPKTRTGTAEAGVALGEARARLLDLRASLVALVDRDAAAYDLVVAAYRRPKVTGEEQAARRAAIQEAMRVATEVPIEMLRVCVDAVKASVAVATLGNPSATSDVAVGLQLLSTATQGALFNVETNLGSLTDQTQVDAFTQNVQRLVRDSRQDWAAVYAASGFVDLLKASARRAGMLTSDGRHLPLA
jgi:formiminotetrahydrofolate cyclodeaminase